MSSPPLSPPPSPQIKELEAPHVPWAGRLKKTYVKRGCILQKNALSFQMHKELTTAQIFEDQIKFSFRLKGVDEVHNERVLHSLQDIAFGFGVCRVLLISNNCSLLQYFHCINFTFVFTTELSYLKNFAVTSFTENFP